MKKKLLTVLLLSAMVLAGNTVVKAEDMLETNTEDVISNTENPNVEDVVDNAIALYSDNIAISEDIFPDEKFRQYLKDNFDKDGNGYFSHDEIESITSIDVNGNGMINSLAGINYFINLKTLECESSKFTTLDVSKNPSLQILKCRNGKLTTLNTGQNPNLQILECGGNQLTALDVSGNPNLRTLECGGNQLTALDVSSNSDLQRLECNVNQLAELDVSSNPNLNVLWCINNKLTNLDISKNLELMNLMCENNQLQELDTSNNKKLEILGCKGNKLTSLDISNNSAMVGLDCSDNQLSNLKTKNSKVKFLWCINNKLSSLGVSENAELVCLRCYNNRLTNLDLSYNGNMPIRTGDYDNPNLLHFSMGGAYAGLQNSTADIVSKNDTWTLDLAAIVGKENLNRVTLATDGAKLSADGTVTFSGSNMPTELVYNYDTKNPAEDTPMTVHVALTQKNVDDQTGEDVTVDTGGLDIDNICKENNINISANFEIILSQDTLSKESLDKLTQAAGTNGYSISATYEILMSLFSNGQKIKDITDNFGRVKLTFRLNSSLAGQNAVVYQLHNNSQVIVHDGLTVNTDGTVTVTVDKFSAFAVAVKPSSNNTGKPDTGQSGTNKPDSNRPGTNQPDTNKPDTNQPNINKPDAGQPNVKQTNANQISPKTGDGVNPVFWIIVAMAASITGILSIKICYKH